MAYPNFKEGPKMAFALLGIKQNWGQIENFINGGAKSSFTWVCKTI
jgi:hypothetical protein